jgi:DNA-binding NarL/FixJ family response regulator
MEIVGEAENGKEAIDLAEKLNPDMILLDLIMPVMDGYLTAETLKKKMPDIKIVILTGTHDEENIFELLEAGIDGYVFKDVKPRELKGAIRSVMHGEAYLDPAITQLALEHSNVEKPSEPPPNLTPRELEVLHWLATPNTYKEIAPKLNISEETIRSHAKNILQKLNQRNRAQAVLYALQVGIIDLPK